jgi:hypothetical protein
MSNTAGSCMDFYDFLYLLGRDGKASLMRHFLFCENCLRQLVLNFRSGGRKPEAQLKNRHIPCSNIWYRKFLFVQETERIDLFYISDMDSHFQV